MLVELGLGDANGRKEVVVGECWVEDGVTEVLQVSRFATAWGGLPTVKEEDFHLMRSCCQRLVIQNTRYGLAIVPGNISIPNHCRRKTSTGTTGIAATTGKTAVSEYRFYLSLTTSTLVLVRSQWISSPV